MVEATIEFRPKHGSLEGFDMGELRVAVREAVAKLTGMAPSAVHTTAAASSTAGHVLAVARIAAHQTPAADRYVDSLKASDASRALALAVHDSAFLVRRDVHIVYEEAASDDPNGDGPAAGLVGACVALTIVLLGAVAAAIRWYQRRRTESPRKGGTSRTAGAAARSGGKKQRLPVADPDEPQADGQGSREDAAGDSCEREAGGMDSADAASSLGTWAGAGNDGRVDAEEEEEEESNGRARPKVRLRDGNAKGKWLAASGSGDDSGSDDLAEVGGKLPAVGGRRRGPTAACPALPRPPAVPDDFD